jgi:large repetitive protein
MIASRPLWSVRFVVTAVAALGCGGLVDGSESRRGSGSDSGAAGSASHGGAPEPGSGGGESGASSMGGAPTGDGAAGSGQAPWRATCGNGWMDPGESCDDANMRPRDGCTPECCIEVYYVPPECFSPSGWCAQHPVPCHCGDGYVEPGEECDDGNLEFGDGCSGYCEFEDGLCGNGVVDGTEECDDGNLESGDSCDPGCYREACHGDMMLPPLPCPLDG